MAEPEVNNYEIDPSQKGSPVFQEDQKLETLRHDLPKLFVKMIVEAVANAEKKDNHDIPDDQKLKFSLVKTLFLNKSYWGDFIMIEDNGKTSRLSLKKDSPQHPVFQKIIDILNADQSTRNIEAFSILSDVRSKLNSIFEDRRPLITQISNYIERMTSNHPQPNNKNPND